MSNLNTRSLNENWTCQWPENQEFIPLLNESSFDDRQMGKNMNVWLQRSFNVEPMDEICLRYFLHIDSAPRDSQVYINEKHIATYSAPFKIDVTDYLWLEDNIIGIRVDRDTPGNFGDIYLQPVPCDQL